MAACALPTDALVTAEERVTPAYVKPYRCGHGDVRYEDPRIDFENAEPPARAAEEALLAAFTKAAEDADVVVVSDQLATGVVTARLRQALCAMAAAGQKVCLLYTSIASATGCVPSFPSATISLCRTLTSSRGR